MTAHAADSATMAGCDEPSSRRGMTEAPLSRVDFESEDPRFAGTRTMTWSVSAEAGATRIVFRADDAPPGTSADDHQEG